MLSTHRFRSPSRTQRYRLRLSVWAIPQPSLRPLRRHSGGTPVSFKLVASKPATPYLVPVGQLLLMEYASGSCVDPSIAQLQVTTRGVETIHNFGFQVQPVPGTLGQVGQFGHLVKIYADPGTQVFFLGVLGCEITVSGQLIIP